MASSFGLSATDAGYVCAATGSALAGQRVRGRTNRMREWANGRGICGPLPTQAKHWGMSEAPSLFGTPRDWAIDLAIITVVGVFLGVIGPFGSFNGGPVELRIAYWVANMWIGFIALSTFVRLSARAAMRFD